MHTHLPIHTCYITYDGLQLYTYPLYMLCYIYLLFNISTLYNKHFVTSNTEIQLIVLIKHVIFYTTDILI